MDTGSQKVGDLEQRNAISNVSCICQYNLIVHFYSSKLTPAGRSSAPVSLDDLPFAQDLPDDIPAGYLLEASCDSLVLSFSFGRKLNGGFGGGDHSEL